ncbi:MAG: alpha/beta hydrolase-fold protein [Rhodothermales bacterium]
MVSNAQRTITEGIIGQINRYEQVDFGALYARNVDVWLPVDYDAAGAPYPLIIAQDGQNLFIPAESFAGVDWGIDEMMTRLASGGEIRSAVVVGIWNSPARLQEYMPERPLYPQRYGKLKQSFAKRFGGVPCSDAYLTQLIETVLPFVEAHYNVARDAKHRMLMGSSMGGLISLYGLSQYPELFGGAACLSTSLTILGEALHDYIDDAPLYAERHRLYFDYGIEGETPAYEQAMRRLERQVKQRGYRVGRDLEVYEVPGAPHAESAWRARLDHPFRFLLQP